MMLTFSTIQIIKALLNFYNLTSAKSKFLICNARVLEKLDILTATFCLDFSENSHHDRSHKTNRTKSSKDGLLVIQTSTQRLKPENSPDLE